MVDTPQAGPREAVLGSGAGGPLTPPTPWITLKDVTSAYILYPNGAVIGNPAGGNKGIGALNLSTLYLNGVMVDLTKYVLWTGGSMTGKLILPGDPVPADGPTTAATKNYVDVLRSNMNATFANYLPLAGGTVTGPIVLPGDPTATNQAANKHYVDTLFSTAGLTVPDAPADGTTYGRNNNAWVNAVDLGTF